MSITHTHNIPPVIRVFLSSTFADMDNERNYFNKVLVPRLNRICAERGVSFFSVDLRWGITEEDQLDGQVLPICLSEIDRCRPYFIGILGNRYGSLMQEVPHQISDSIPWLQDKEGKSITELEMLYAILDHSRDDNVAHASFYFRSNELTETWYGPTEEDSNLKELKQRICADSTINNSTYGSIEEFGEKVMQDILAWCDQEFPIPERVQEVRRAWYNGEILRNYIPMEENHTFLDKYCKESQRSLLLYGEGESGKTTLLSAWTPKEGDKLLINCGSDDAFHYWPTVVNTIIREIGQITTPSVLPDAPLRSAMVRGMLHTLFNKQETSASSNNEFYFTSPKDQETFRTAFLNWINNITLPQPIYVIINDFNLLEDDESRMLSWLPSKTSGSIRFIVSTNKEDTVEIADIIGWNCKEMPAFNKKHASHYVSSYLNIYGKNLSDTQMKLLMAAPITISPGHLRTTCNFLINHGRFQNLNTLIQDISTLSKSTDLYPYLYDYVTNEAGENVTAVTNYVLGLLLYSPLSLTESECHSLVSNRFTVTALEWSAVRNILEQFRVIKGDNWNITTSDVQALISSRLTEDESISICEVLGDYYTSRLLETTKNDDEDSTQTVDSRQATAYAQAVLTLYTKAQNNVKLLSALGDAHILLPIYRTERHVIRAAWLHVFLSNTEDVETPAFEIFKDIYARFGAKHPLTIAMADLFIDMEFSKYLESVNEQMGDVRFYGSVHENFDSFSREFLVVMKKLLDVRSKETTRNFHTLICQLLQNSENYQPVELCQLLFFKADCEMKLCADSELLKTANLYFKKAVTTGNNFEFQRAISMLANAHHRNDNDAESAKLHDKLVDIYHSRGIFRGYMVESVALALALSGLELYNKALSILIKTFQLWIKNGDIIEASTVQLNICNLLFEKGDLEDALDLATSRYNALKKFTSKQALRISTSFLGNMGKYAFHLKRYPLAKTYLLETLEKAEEFGFESTFLNAVNVLSKLYLKTGSYINGFELEERAMEMYWKRAEYDSVMSAFKKAREFLHHCNHLNQLKNFIEKWRQRFSTIEGGEQYFLKEISSTVYDSREIERLQEALAMARSDGNPKTICETMRKLAKALKENDFQKYWDIMIQAAELYREHSLIQELELHVHDMLIDCMNQGEPRPDSDLKTILSYALSPDTHEIASIWTQLGQYAQEASKEKNSSNIESLLEKILTYADTYQNTIFHCLHDVAALLVHNATAETLIRCVHTMPDQQKRLLEIHFEKAYLDTSSQDLDKLKSEYSGFTANNLLQFYERAITFLTEIDSNNVATLSGNIALIFRRRKDEEKTLYYHQISMEAYRRQNSLYDCLIEKMNLSTALKEFGRHAEAIAKLREALQEAQDNIPSLEAAIAGNLAAILRDHGEGDNHEEIIRCFSIEENFFRSENLARDLVISLINQVGYYIKQKNIEPCVAKVEEAGRLTRQYKFTDFYQALAMVENIVAQATAAPHNATTESPEDFIRDILSVNENYEVGNVYEENGEYYAECFLKKEDPLHQEKIILVFHPEIDNELTFWGGFLPQQYNESAREIVESYLTWNNESLPYYSLTLSENFQVQGGCKVCAATREELKRQLRFYLSLWVCDCANLTLLSLGFPDVDTCKGVKLHAISGANDDESP